MSVLNPQSLVGELVAERPARARVFESLGIDYCCGGRKPLGQACQERGVDVDQVTTALEDAAQPQCSDEQDWMQASLTALADHIEQTHHAYLRKEMPRLAGLIEHVHRAHGNKHAWLSELAEVYEGMHQELSLHMLKEEQMLFPMIRALEAGEASPHAQCGSICNPIAVMEHEHDDAGSALRRMRELTNGFAPPPNACNTFRVMLASLAELEADLHQHIHKENNVLFPRAAELERAST